MKAKQHFFVLVGIFVVILLAIGGLVYEGNQQLSKEATKLAQLKGDSQTLDTLQTTLAKNKKDIAKYSELNTIAATIVPQDKDQAEAVREIVNLANQSGFSPSSITFPTSTLGSLQVGGPKTPAGLTQLTPVKTISGLYSLQITVTQDSSNPVPYNQFISFLQKLEQNRRTAQVTSINVTPDPQHPSVVSFILIMNEYIKP